MNKKFYCLTTIFSLLVIYVYPFKQSYYDYAYGLLYIQSLNYRAAIEKFENVIQTDPQAVDVYQQLIYLYILENETDKLKKICEKIDTVITDVDTLVEICNTLSSYGYKNIAIEILERLVSNNNNKNLLLTLAQIYFLSDAEKSLYYYKRYLQICPEDTNVYLPMAILEYQKGNLYEAKKLLEKVYNTTPEVKNLPLLEHFMSSMTTDYNLLLEKYEETVRLEPNNHKLIGILFSAFVNNGETDKAEKYLKQVLSIPKKEFLPEYYFYIALFYEQKKQPLTAAKYMEKFIKQSKIDNEVPYIKLAYYYILVKQYNKAIKVLSTANKKFKTESVKILLLYTYLDDKKYNNAIQILYELKSTTSSFKRTDFYLGYCYDQLKNFEKTEFYLKEAINKNPDDHEALNYLGYLYADKNINLDTAEQLILRALSYEPTNYAYIDSLAWVYYRKNMYEKAEQLFEQIKTVDDPIICEHIGDVKMQLGKYNEAVEFYSKSLQLNRRNKNVLRKLQNVKQKLKLKR